MAQVPLSVELTDAERAKYESRRRPDGVTLPSYFSAEENSEVPISREFEAFVILTDKSTRTSLVNWLSNASSRGEINQGRNQLFKEVCEIQLEDATNELVESDRDLVEFTSFRNELFAGKFATVGEVVTLINDLQLGIQSKSKRRDRAQNRSTSVSILAQLHDLNEDTILRRQQAESWSGVLLAY